MDRTHGTLAGIGRQIRARYNSLAKSDAVENPKWAAFDNEMQRFELWARNLGLYTGGHSSLDYRFRDAQLLFDHTLELLGDLERLLAQSLKLVTGDISLEEEEEEDSSEDSEDEDDASYQNMPLFEILTDSAVATIDRLYRLAFKIRNPSMRLGSSRALEYREVDQSTGIDLMKQFVALDEQYIQDLLLSYGHSHADSHYLIPRLARANTRRRQQFRYWRKRRDAFERLSTADLVGEHDDKRPEPMAEERQDLLVPGEEPIIITPPQPSTATWLNPEKVKLDDDMSAISTVSYLYSSEVEDGDCVSLPVPPKLSPEAKEFECPYCFTICPRKLLNKRNWEAHILRDLRPYICTYRHCKAPDQPYDSMSDWINHENANHRMKVPNEDGNQISHIEHDASRNCPFCLVPAASPMHVASHLHRVASFALPRSGGDEDMQDGSKQSDQAEVRTRESQLSAVTLGNGSENECGNDISSSRAEHVSSFALEDLRKIGTGNHTELSNVHSFLGAVDTGSSIYSAILDAITDGGSQSKGQRGETPKHVPKEASDGNAEPPSRTGKDEGPREIPAPYDATDDALALRDALCHADVNTKTLIQALPCRTHAEILELRKRYNDYVKVKGKGVNVAKHIHLRLHNSTLGNACYATALGRWESESYWVSHYCTSSSYRRLLLESLSGRSNNEVRYIKKSFKDQQYDGLEEFINGKLKGGNFRTAVLLGLEGSRQSWNDPIDPELVASDVQALRSGLRQGDGDEMAMIHIIVRRSDPHLREVIRAYQKLYEQDVANEIIHKSQNAVTELLVHILYGAMNRPVRDALLLHHALWKSRSDNERSILLISRLVRFHWEPQHLVKVKAQYHRRYDHPLEDAIAGEILPSSGGSEWGEFCIQLLRSSEMHAVKA